MTWVFHDSFKTIKAAEEAGGNIVKLGLAKGVKVTKTGKKSKPYMLFILPIKEREEK
jgi:hypothetical protein